MMSESVTKYIMSTNFFMVDRPVVNSCYALRVCDYVGCNKNLFGGGVMPHKMRKVGNGVMMEHNSHIN